MMLYYTPMVNFGDEDCPINNITTNSQISPSDDTDNYLPSFQTTLTTEPVIMICFTMSGFLRQTQHFHFMVSIRLFLKLDVNFFS